MRTYYRVDSLRDRSRPIGLFRINCDSAAQRLSYETFNRSTGEWKDDPSNAMYVMQGEPGATLITEAEAARLERELLRPS